MTNPLSLRPSALVLFIFLFLAAACAGPKATRFYALNSVITADTLQKAHAIDSGPVIGVGPVEIPDYLDRPHIVTRTGRNELGVADFDKWAGSLRDGIARVLAENLAVLLSTDSVHVYPSRRSVPLKYQVTVDVIQFDGRPGKSVLLKARWTIFTGRSKKALMKNTSQFSRRTDAGTYRALVAAKSRVLADLSRDIAGAIMSIETGVTGNEKTASPDPVTPD